MRFFLTPGREVRYSCSLDASRGTQPIALLQPSFLCRLTLRISLCQTVPLAQWGTPSAVGKPPSAQGLQVQWKPKCLPYHHSLGHRRSNPVLLLAAVVNESHKKEALEQGIARNFRTALLAQFLQGYKCVLQLEALVKYTGGDCSMH